MWISRLLSHELIRKRMMEKRCCCVSDIVEEADRILFHELDCLHSKDAEFYFRGESLNFARKNEGKALPLGTAFPCSLDREEAWWKNERELYQEALRLDVISFDEDKTMVERLARMQHYQMPTRFCDMTTSRAPPARAFCFRRTSASASTPGPSRRCADARS